MQQRTADNAFAVAHNGDCIAGHVRNGDAQQLLTFFHVPQTNILRRARGHQVTAAATTQSVRSCDGLHSRSSGRCLDYGWHNARREVRNGIVKQTRLA